MSKRIPHKEAELKALAEVIIGGLKTDPEIFKDPPVTFEQLTETVNHVTLSIDNVAQNKAGYEASIQAKDLNVKKMYKQVTYIAEYAYRITNEDQALLSKIGLTLRSEPKPIEAPGQCRLFNVEKQGIDSVVFTWKQPVRGGRVRAYIIQRQEAENLSTPWINVWTEFGKEAEIKDQPKDVFLDYRVRSLNNSGIGEPSNTITLKF
jgi:hypothetical protein